MSHKNSLLIVLLYLLTGVAFGHGLVTLIIGGRSEWSLVFITWLAAVVLLIANYRRLTRHAARG